MNFKHPSEASNKKYLQGYTKEEVLDLIPRHKDYSPDLSKLIHTIPEEILSNIASTSARSLDRMIKQIFREFERVKQFTRTKLNDFGILYGEIATKHVIEDWIIEYFYQRFPSCWLCLYNVSKRQTLIWRGESKWYYSSNPLENVIQNLSKKREKTPYFADICVNNEELFNTFYKTQYIPTRKNKRYYQQVIPLKARKLPGLKGKIETNLENKKMDSYLVKPKNIKS